MMILFILLALIFSSDNRSYFRKECGWYKNGCYKIRHLNQLPGKAILV